MGQSRGLLSLSGDGMIGCVCVGGGGGYFHIGSSCFICFSHYYINNMRFLYFALAMKPNTNEMYMQRK